MIETQCENMINQFAQQMAQQGLSMEQYLQFSGTDTGSVKRAGSPGCDHTYQEQPCT